MAVVIAAYFKTLNWGMMKAAFEGTMRTTAMIMLIVFAAIFLNFVLGFMGITQAMLNFIRDMGLTPVQTVLLIIVFYLFLGMFMETLSMMLTTIPVVFPIAMHMGFDPIWFGIMITVLMEAALITPPIGLNVFVLKSVLPDVATGQIFRGVTPFWIADIIRLALIVAIPVIALWLPGVIR